MTASIEVDLDVSDDELVDVEARLEKLETDSVEIDIRVDDDELHAAAAKAEMLDGKELDLEADWDDDGFSDALRRWEDLQREGSTSRRFRTEETTQHNSYYNGLSKEERERLEKLRSMDSRDIDAEVKAAIEEESLASTEAALNRLARDRTSEVETEWDDDGIQNALDQLHEERDREGAFTSISTRRSYRSSYDGLTDEEQEELERLEKINSKTVETEVKSTVDSQSLVSTEAALNRVARDRTTEIDVDHDAVGSFIAQPLELPGSGGAGGPGTDYNFRMDGDPVFDLNPKDIPGGKKSPGNLTWGQLSDLGKVGGDHDVERGFSERRLNIEKAEISEWELDGHGKPLEYSTRDMSKGEKRRYRKEAFRNKDSVRDQVDLLAELLTAEVRDNDKIESRRGFGNPMDLFDRDKRAIKSMSPLPDDGLLRKINRSGNKLTGTLKRGLIPSMSTLYSLFAAMAPLLAAVAVNLVGVAGAMGLVAGAGAALIGGGLLGHAQSLEESTAEAQERVQDLKKDLFKAFQPAFQAFAPISDRILSKIPMYARDFAQELEGVTVFEDIVDSGIEGVFGFLADATEIAVNHSEEIEQLTRRFGSRFGNLALDGLRWLIEEAHRNQDLLDRLITTLVLIGKILYNLAEFIARAASHFNGLFEIVAWGSELLSGSGFASTILQLITWIAVLGKVAGGTAGILTWLFKAFAITKIARAAGAVYGLIQAVMALNASLAVTAGLMAGLTLGATALIGGAAYMSNKPSGNVPDVGGGRGGGGGTPGFSPYGPGGGGGGGGGGSQVNINMYGDVREEDMDRLERKTREVVRDEGKIGQHRDRSGKAGDGNRR